MFGENGLQVLCRGGLVSPWILIMIFDVDVDVFVDDVF